MRLDKVIAVRTDKTVYKDGDNVIKIFNGKYSKADVLTEALNLAKIEETDLNVPTLLEVTKIDGKWAIITKFIRGVTLELLMKEEPDKHKTYINLFVELQRKIFEKKALIFNRLEEKMCFKISSANLEDDLKDEFCRRIDEMPKDKKLCHGDFNPSNIIITDDNKPYILDWSHVTTGNKDFDAAWSYLLFLMSNEIAAAEEYMELFAAKTKTDRQSIIEKIPFVAAAHFAESNEEGRKFLASVMKENVI